MQDPNCNICVNHSIEVRGENWSFLTNRVWKQFYDPPPHDDDNEGDNDDDDGDGDEDNDVDDIDDNDVDDIDDMDNIDDVDDENNVEDDDDHDSDDGHTCASRWLVTHVSTVIDTIADLFQKIIGKFFFFFRNPTYCSQLMIARPETRVCIFDWKSRSMSGEDIRARGGPNMIWYN